METQKETSNVIFAGTKMELARRIAEKIRDLNASGLNWAVGLNANGEVDSSHEGARGLRVCLVEQACDLSALGVDDPDLEFEWTDDITHGLADCFAHDWLDDYNSQADPDEQIEFLGDTPAYKAGFSDGLKWDLDGFRSRAEVQEERAGWDTATINAIGLDAFLAHCGASASDDESAVCEAYNLGAYAGACSANHCGIGTRDELSEAE